MRKKERNEEKMLDVDASMQGNLIFKDPVNLRISGTFEGTLDTKGTLTVGENAIVKANVKGEIIRIAGSVYGDIEASRAISLVPPARVVGNLRTPLLAIAEGSIFEGNSHMLKGKDNKAVFNKDMLTIEDVARYLEVDRSLILSWAAEGKLPAVKEKDTWKFERNALDAWIANEKIR